MKKLFFFFLLISLRSSAQPLHIRPSLLIIVKEKDADSLHLKFFRINEENDTLSYGLEQDHNWYRSYVIRSDEKGQYILKATRGKELMVIYFLTEGADMHADYY